MPSGGPQGPTEEGGWGATAGGEDDGPEDAEGVKSLRAPPDHMMSDEGPGREKHWPPPGPPPLGAVVGACTCREGGKATTTRR